MKIYESGLTGRLFESEVLPRLSDAWRHQGYFDEKRSFDWVRQNQEWNPSDPSNKIANNLHCSVAEKLELDDYNELKFYSALNSPLDYYYGIDAFLELDGDVYTLDLSINSHKEEAKADMVVSEHDLMTDEGIEDLANRIARFYSKKRAGKGNSNSYLSSIK